ncbi:MAG: twin-arginine translocase subunit TatC [Planctomycetaceae bacterium]|nr:twin-arginine translocase subunit TatC [Planctomycetaceae bacterium]MCP4479665.1 twin-arginine translocase subunit TatC [Planctomycetaceae bacterium]MCP4775026.1 twin-arginine translocase subunit TatC [Planctomycetaceae bacterium]
MNFRQSNEDLFESSRMSFGEHLEELRSVLVRALIGVAIAGVFGFYFADQVVEILKKPLVEAILKFDLEDASDELVERYGFVPPEYLPWMQQDQRIPKQVQISPAELALALKTVIPDFAEKVNLEPFGFRASHFDSDQLVNLCKQLTEPTDESSPTAKKIAAISASLTAADRETLANIASQTSTSPEDLNQVVTVFNHLVKAETIHQSAAFDDLLELDESKGLWAMLEPPETKPLASVRKQLKEKNDPVLTQRLNRALITYVFSEQMPPFKADLVPIEIWENGEFEPLALGVAEPFTVWLKAGLFTSLILSGPWIFFQIWSFVASGLYPHEQKYIHVFLPISILLFVTGVLLAFYFVFQPVLGFLFSFNRSMGIAPEMRINDWLSFVMFLPLGFGLAFQLPLVMLFMNRIGLFTVENYLSKWRVAVLVIFVLAMFLTPADPISMLLLAVPLTFLYFMGVAMCKWMPHNENPFGDETTAGV